MTQPGDYRKFAALLQEADEDFRTDVAYAVAVAKAARSLAARRKKVPAGGFLKPTHLIPANETGTVELDTY